MKLEYHSQLHLSSVDIVDKNLKSHKHKPRDGLYIRTRTLACLPFTKIKHSHVILVQWDFLVSVTAQLKPVEKAVAFLGW